MQYYGNAKTTDEYYGFFVSRILILRREERKREEAYMNKRFLMF